MDQPLAPRIALILLAVLVALLAIGSMLDDSATADEAAHIAAGLIKLQQGRIEFFTAQPPLLETLIAIPVALAGHRAPEVEGNRPWQAGHTLLYRSGYDPEQILTLARLPVIALFLALAFAVFAYVRNVTNDAWAGVAAFALTAFCPTLLAHGRLATVDIGVTLLMFLAATSFHRRRDVPSGMATAGALASKVSAALLVPYFAIVALWQRRFAWRAGLIAIATFMVIYLAIGRSLDPLLPFRSFLAEAGAVKTLYAQRYALPQFLLGEFSPAGWRHYYLVALAVKLTIPALALIALAVTRKPRKETIACAIFIALFLLVSAFSNLNLGIRHILPIFPFVYAAIVIALHDTPRRLRNVAALLVVAHVAIGVAAYPSYISYFNAFVRDEDAVLIDSNLDWGQDLERLHHWTREQGIAKIRIHYFGGGSVEREFGAEAERWSLARGERLPPGYFAVSRHFYRLSFDRTRSAHDYDSYLRASNARFVTTIGGSIDVYAVESPPQQLKDG